MKKIVIFGLLFISVLKGFSQNDTEHFNNGLKFLDSNDNLKAIEQFNQAIKINPDNKKYYYNRAFAYLNLGDTCKSCEDFHRSLKLGSLRSKFMIKKNCLPCDSISYRYFIAAQKEINMNNYSKADSLLSLSMMNIKYLPNCFHRGLIRFYMGDTLGFCSDMRSSYAISDGARENCLTYCTDTIFYDKTYLERTDHSKYYEVFYKPGFGAVYNEKVTLITFGFDPYIEYWKNSHMIGYYNIIEDKQVYLFADVDPGYSYSLADFLNKKLKKDTTITEVLQRYNLEKYVQPVNIIVSPNGSISSVDIISSSKEEINEEKRRDDLLDDIILKKLNELSAIAPKAKPAKIGKRTVYFQYTMLIKIEG